MGEAFLHAWKGYTRYAWGRDELRPLSRTGTNPYGGLGLSILDSLTTLLLFDLSTEFEHAMEFVRRHLVFGAEDPQVSVFELTIRALGGLLGAHSLSGRHSLLRRARELAERLLPTFNTTSGVGRTWQLPTHVSCRRSAAFKSNGDTSLCRLAMFSFKCLQTERLRPFRLVV